MSSSAMDSISISDIDVASSTQTQTTINTLPDELLLAVLGVLSINDRAKVRTVSKKWNDLVMDLGIHLEPVFIDDQLGVPFYSNDIAIRLNHRAFSYDVRGQSKLAADLKIPFENLDEADVDIIIWLPSQRSEFLTDPPISTLAFQVTGPPDTPRESQEQPMHAVMRNTKSFGGIRLGDFLDVCDKMRAYDTRLSLAGWGFVAWFATEGDGVHYEIVSERADARGGMEVRKCTKKDN